MKVPVSVRSSSLVGGGKWFFVWGICPSSWPPFRHPAEAASYFARGCRGRLGCPADAATSPAKRVTLATQPVLIPAAAPPGWSPCAVTPTTGPLLPLKPPFKAGGKLQRGQRFITPNVRRIRKGPRRDSTVLINCIKTPTWLFGHQNCLALLPELVGTRFRCRKTVPSPPV